MRCIRLCACVAFLYRAQRFYKNCAVQVYIAHFECLKKQWLFGEILPSMHTKQAATVSLWQNGRIV